MISKQKIEQLKKHLSHSIFKNISWLFLDKICRLGVGLLVSVWVTKYLGPLDFGKYYKQNLYYSFYEL